MESTENTTITLELTIKLKPEPHIEMVRRFTSTGRPQGRPPIAPETRASDASVLGGNGRGRPKTWRHPNERTWIGAGWRHRLAQAESGQMPDFPDYSAGTHRNYRAKIARLKQMADECDLEALKATIIVERSSTPESMAKYRDLAIHAIERSRR